MSRPSSEDKLIQQLQVFSIKQEVRFNGAVKNLLINDCIKRGICKANLVRNIVAMYYGIIEEAPLLREKEMVEIKNFIMAKIKF